MVEGWGWNRLYSFQQVWFYRLEGIVHRSLYPTVDRPSSGPSYLITDGKSFFHEEKRNLESKLEHLPDHCLGYRCTNSDPAGHYAIVKEIMADPHLACVIQRPALTGANRSSKAAALALCAPHLEVGAGATTAMWREWRAERS